MVLVHYLKVDTHDRHPCGPSPGTFVLTLSIRLSGTTMSLLQGKVVCITGASRGIGRATAIEACQHGAFGLILHYLGDGETTEEMQSLNKEVSEINEACKIIAIPGDIGSRSTSFEVQVLQFSQT